MLSNAHFNNVRIHIFHIECACQQNYCQVYSAFLEGYAIKQQVMTKLIQRIFGIVIVFTVVEKMHLQRGTVQSSQPAVMHRFRACSRQYFITTHV